MASNTSLDLVLSEIKSFRVEFTKIHNEIGKINSRLDKIENRLDKIENRLDKVETILDDHSHKLDQLLDYSGHSNTKKKNSSAVLAHVAIAAKDK